MLRHERSSDDDFHMSSSPAKVQIDILSKPLRIYSGQDSYCISRAPPALGGINEYAHKPKMISIGPYHHGKTYCEDMDKHKWRYLCAHIERTGESYDQRFKKYKEVIGSMEERIRECYSEAVSYNREQLIEIMIFDGCFLIELFTRAYESHTTQIFDPLLNCFKFHLEKDLLQLENQIPFFVLESLFELSLETFPRKISVQNVALSFFCPAFKSAQFDYAIDHKAKHLLHLLHEVLNHPVKRRLSGYCEKLTPSISILLSSGVKLKIIKDRTFLDIRLKNNVLEIPCLPLDTVNASLLRNCVAFETCFKHCPQYFIDYISFISSLVRTPCDVALLSEAIITENGHVSHEEIASFFSKVNKQVCNDAKYSYLYEVINGLNNFAENNWCGHWSIFRHKFFQSSWTSLTFVAALLLMLSIVQATFTILQYLDHKKFNAK